MLLKQALGQAQKNKGGGKKSDSNDSEGVSFSQIQAIMSILQSRGLPNGNTTGGWPDSAEIGSSGKGWGSSGNGNGWGDTASGKTGWTGSAKSHDHSGSGGWGASSSAGWGNHEEASGAKSTGIAAWGNTVAETGGDDHTWGIAGAQAPPGSSWEKKNDPWSDEGSWVMSGEGNGQTSGDGWGGLSWKDNPKNDSWPTDDQNKTSNDIDSRGGSADGENAKSSAEWGNNPRWSGNVDVSASSDWAGGAEGDTGKWNQRPDADGSRNYKIDKYQSHTRWNDGRNNDGWNSAYGRSSERRSDERRGDDPLHGKKSNTNGPPYRWHNNNSSTNWNKDDHGGNDPNWGGGGDPWDVYRGGHHYGRVSDYGRVC